MPVDLAAVAARFAEPLAGQTGRLPELFARLARTLVRLRRQIDAADVATRAFPVVRIRDEAIAVRVVPAVAPGTNAPPALAEDAARGGRAFVDGIAWVATAVRQELLIPGLGRVAAAAVEEVEASTARVLALGPSVFDPRRATASELPAFGALGVRVAVEAGLLRRSPPSPRRPGATTPAEAPPDLLELPDLVAGMSSAVVLALPAATVVLAGTVRTLSLSARVRALDELTGAERSLLGVHTAVAELLTGATGPAAVVAGWAPIIEGLVLADVTVLTTWLPVAAGHVIDGVNRVIDSVNGSVRSVVELVDTVLQIVQAITGVDVLAPLAPSFSRLGLTPPSLTIGELIDAGSEAAARARALELAGSLAVVAAAVRPFSERDARIFLHLGAMLAILGAHGVGRITVPAVPAPTHLPNLVATLFPPDIDAVAGGLVQGIADDVRVAVGGSLRATAGLATDLGTAIDAVAADARTGVGGVPLGLAARQAAATTDQVLGPEIERQRAVAAARTARLGRDPFVDMFATTGFTVAGGLVPHYLAGVRRFLRRRALRPTPTSPHVLARHGRLIGVRTDRVVVRAAGRAVDGATAAEVADRLRATFGDLYLDGRRRVDDAAAAAAAGGR